MKIVGAALIIMGLLLAGAQADPLALPDQLKTIEEETFAGDESIREAIVPDTVVSIGDRAFSGCSNLAKIHIPAGITALGEEILRGCTEDVLIISPEMNPVVLDYAFRNQIDFQCGTQYRALLIAQSYEDDEKLALEGPENDVAAFAEILKLYEETPYQVNIRRNLTASGILGAVKEVFGEAGPQDVSLFYYSGHASTERDDSRRGGLIGIDGISCVTPKQLRAALDQIPGRKILIIDACCSGNLLGGDSGDTDIPLPLSEVQTSKAEVFTQSLVSTFKRKSRAFTLNSEYYILTAAAEDEMSYEDVVNGKVMGLFTSVMLQGCGRHNRAAPADLNQNNILTLREIYSYTYGKLIDEGQHVQVYPENCSWFGVFRKKVSFSSVQ